MTNEEYLKFTNEMSYYPGGLTYLGLAITGEAGEVADDIKKMIRDDDGLLTDNRRQKLLLELGDVLFYAFQLAQTLGVTISEVMELNREKLVARRKRLDNEGIVGIKHIG